MFAGRPLAPVSIIHALGTDKAECRYLVRRIMNLWHMEDPSVHKAMVTIRSLTSNWCAEFGLGLPENEL